MMMRMVTGLIALVAALLLPGATPAWAEIQNPTVTQGASSGIASVSVSGAIVTLTNKDSSVLTASLNSGTAVSTNSRPFTQADDRQTLVTADTANLPYCFPQLTPSTNFDIFQGLAGSPIFSACSGSGVVIHYSAGSPTGANSILGPMEFVTAHYVDATHVTISGATAVQTAQQVINYLSTSAMGSLAYWRNQSTMTYDTGDWNVQLANMTSTAIPPPANEAAIPPLVTGIPLQSAGTFGQNIAGCPAGSMLASLNDELEVYPSGGAIKCLGPSWNPYSVLTNSTYPNLPANYLRITASKLSPSQVTVAQNTTGTTRPTWLSGFLTTNPYSQSNGVFVACMRTDPAHGAWPAFWGGSPMGWNNGPEVDITEGSGVYSNRNYTSDHDTIAGIIQQQSDIPGGIGALPCTEYGLVKSDDEMIYYLNGEEVFRTPTPAGNRVKLFWEWNLAIAGPTDFVGGTDASTPASITTDVYYVRAYQLPAGANLNTNFTGPAVTAHMTTPAMNFVASKGIGGAAAVASNFLLPATVLPPAPLTVQFTVNANALYGGAYILDAKNPVGGSSLYLRTDGSNNFTLTISGTYGPGAGCTDTTVSSPSGLHLIRLLFTKDYKVSMSVDGDAVPACTNIGTFIQGQQNSWDFNHSIYYSIGELQAWQGLLNTPGQTFTPPTAPAVGNEPNLIFVNHLTGPDSSALIASPTVYDMPAPLTGLSVSNITQTSALVSWTAPTAGATPAGWVVGNSNGVYLGTAPAGATSFQVNNLPIGTTTGIGFTPFAKTSGVGASINVTTLPAVAVTSAILAPNGTSLTLVFNTALTVDPSKFSFTVAGSTVSATDADAATSSLSHVFSLATAATAGQAVAYATSTTAAASPALGATSSGAVINNVGTSGAFPMVFTGATGSTLTGQQALTSLGGPTGVTQDGSGNIIVANTGDGRGAFVTAGIQGDGTLTATLSGSSKDMAMVLRANPSTNNFYLLQFQFQSQVHMLSVVNGVVTALGSGTIPSGATSLGFGVAGSTLTAYASGVKLFSATDTSIPAAGYPGIGQSATNSGATLVSRLTYQ